MNVYVTYVKGAIDVENCFQIAYVNKIKPF